MHSKDSLADVWFDRESAAARLDAGSPPAKPPPRTRDLLRSGLAGSVGGLFGGILALATADGFKHAHRLADHVRLALGQAHAVGRLTPTTTREWVGAAALAGAFLGGCFGALMRRLIPTLPRLLFGGVVSAALCTLLYAFVLLRLAPAVAGAASFASCLLGALVYGACVGIVPPVRRALRFDEDDETPEPPLPLLPADATPPVRPRLTSLLADHRSFPLVRRRPDS
jgi:hypothetical protein